MRKKRTAKQGQWRNRIYGHAMLNPLEIVTNPANYKAHPDQQAEALKGAIDEIGFLRSVTINRRTGTLIDGHLRVALAIKHKQKAIGVEYVDLSLAEEKAALACLDPLGQMADYDQDKLAALAKELDSETPSINRLIQNLVDGDDDTPAGKKKARKPATNTQIKIGAFAFDVPKRAYDRWLGKVREKVGVEEDDIVEEIKTRLGL
jgi:hypothetical protein